MPTTRETVLAALQARLQPLAALVLRDEVLPERIPAAGLIILRDGQPSDPEVTLSPLRYHYQHRAELEVVVQTPTGRATVFDGLIASIGAELEADRTLAKPWPGEIAVYRSAATDGFALLTTFSSRARMGVLAADFFAGPVSRFDLGNALVVDVYSGTLESVTDITLLGGANALAVETSAGQWEIVQAGAAELIAPGRYRLTRLLRGQRGTEWAMVSIVPTGARVVVLDTAVAPLPISEADLGLPWNWRIGPA